MMSSERFESCPSCGRFVSVEDNYISWYEPLVFCDHDCAEFWRAQIRGDVCFFCVEVGTNICAVCDRLLCLRCAQFHSAIPGYDGFACVPPFESMYQLTG